MATKQKRGAFTVTFEIYADKAKQYRWRLKASNGRVLADSGESYTRQRDCLRAAVRVVALIQALDVRSVRVTR